VGFQQGEQQERIEGRQLIDQAQDLVVARR
jgi:hypothetical protein